MGGRRRNERTMQGVIDDVIALGKDHGQISAGDIQQAIGPRSYGPFLFVPAVCEISPLGAIPGVPTLMALMVALFAAQMLLGKQAFWMPTWIRQRSVDSDKLEAGLSKVRPALRWLDKLIRPRLRWATSGPFVRLVAAICLLLTVMVPPLELVPFASSLPFAAICLFGLGLTARDGVVIMLAIAASLTAFYLGVTWLTTG